MLELWVYPNNIKLKPANTTALLSHEDAAISDPNTWDFDSSGLETTAELWMSKYVVGMG